MIDKPKSTDYPIGSVIEVMGRTFLKRRESNFVAEGQPYDAEMWTAEDNREFTPTLLFTKGMSEPAFAPLETPKDET